jgi:hypothetical protein
VKNSFVTGGSHANRKKARNQADQANIAQGMLFFHWEILAHPLVRGFARHFLTLSHCKELKSTR